MMKTFKKPKYGIDAPDIIIKWGGAGIILLGLSIYLGGILPVNGRSKALVFLMTCCAYMGIWPAITIFLGSIKFKFRERDWLLESLRLQGHEQVLDVGCGHGLLLIGAAKRLTTGRAQGVDLWVQADQAANSKEATLRNAELEGVLDKVEIHDGNMMKLPFADASFDVIVSSWAIHNLYKVEDRKKALLEIARVLRPSGRIAILDIDHAPSYRDAFLEMGFGSVEMLGPRKTFGNKTYLVLGTKIS